MDYLIPLQPILHIGFNCWTSCSDLKISISEIKLQALNLKIFLPYWKTIHDPVNMCLVQKHHILFILSRAHHEQVYAGLVYMKNVVKISPIKNTVEHHDGGN
jgi:hypothetical protein